MKIKKSVRLLVAVIILTALVLFFTLPFWIQHTLIMGGELHAYTWVWKYLNTQKATTFFGMLWAIFAAFGIPGFEVAAIASFIEELKRIKARQQRKNRTK